MESSLRDSQEVVSFSFCGCCQAVTQRYSFSLVGKGSGAMSKIGCPVNLLVLNKRAPAPVAHGVGYASGLPATTIPAALGRLGRLILDDPLPNRHPLNSHAGT